MKDNKNWNVTLNMNHIKWLDQFKECSMLNVRYISGSTERWIDFNLRISIQRHVTQIEKCQRQSEKSEMTKKIYILSFCLFNEWRQCTLTFDQGYLHATPIFCSNACHSFNCDALKIEKHYLYYQITVYFIQMSEWIFSPTI